MSNIDIKTVTLAINSEQAQRKLDEINKKLEETRKKKSEAFDRGDGKALQAYAKEIKSLEAQSARLQSRASTVKKVLENLDKATPRELKATIKEINRELNSGSVKRGEKQWKALTRGLQEANAELKKIKDEQKAAEKDLGGSNYKGLAKFGAKWNGLAVVADSALNKLSAAKEYMKQFVDEYAEMAEHESGVAKYTGLAKEEVDALNESFKRLDTRTPREKLNDLAADAGRLGIQSKEAVLDFVEAADQINVALGEDLGEDAVKNIGKLAQMFGDADRMGLKQAMLSTGSVINELAQSSSASEGYLMEFTSRLAGVGKQAGMTQADVMAFGSVLDQNMVNVEKGATALQNVITALYANPAKLAKVAGLDVKEFTKLLKTDGNAAVLKFIEALRKAGKMDALAPMLKDMKLSGSGVTQTLSTLAANLQQVKETQQQATRAFEDGTSVTNEFNTANNTAKGELEKAQKRAKDLRVELGEKLYPAFTAMIEGGNTLLSVLMKIGPWLKAHAKEITVVTAVIVTHAVVVRAAAVQTALLAAKTALATVAQKAWNASVAVGNTVMNLAKGLVLASSVEIYKYRGNLVKARAAQIALNKVMNKNVYAAIAAAVIAVGGAIYLLSLIHI